MPPPHHQNRLLLTAGLVSIAYFYWKRQNRPKRKAGDPCPQYNDKEWESLLLHYNKMVPSASTSTGSPNCIYLDYNGTTPIYPEGQICTLLASWPHLSPVNLNFDSSSGIYVAFLNGPFEMGD